MGFGEAVLTCFRKFVTFRGRARRSEYRYFGLFYTIAWIAARAFEIMMLASTRPGPVSWLLFLVLLLPSVSVSVRRLHDVNRSGWVVGAYFTYVVAASALLFLIFVRSRISTSKSTALVVILLLGGVIIWTTWITRLAIGKGTSGPNRYGPDPIQL